jgi:murein DD-endopeptidase MepM/ murein hydrolase activator NlpD
MTYSFATDRPTVRPSIRWAAMVLAVAVVLVAGGWASAAVDKAPTPSIAKATNGDTGNLSGLKLRLVGVINSENHPKALVAVDGVEEEMLVGEGDFLGGFTLETIGEERIELVRGAERQTVTMQHLRWIHADAKAKTLTPKPLDRPAADPDVAPARHERSETVVASAAPKRPASPAASSQRPAFQMPIDGHVTSPFGLRERPVADSGLLGSKYHQGIDIASGHSATIKAAAAGTVSAAGYSFTMGNYINIEHSGGYETRYYHMEKRYAQRGQTVKAGQALGVEGDTGVVTGPHLHFEIRKDGVAINPASFLPALKK